MRHQVGNLDQKVDRLEGRLEGLGQKMERSQAEIVELLLRLVGQDPNASWSLSSRRARIPESLLRLIVPGLTDDVHLEPRRPRGTPQRDRGNLLIGSREGAGAQLGPPPGSQEALGPQVLPGLQRGAGIPKRPMDADRVQVGARRADGRQAACRDVVRQVPGGAAASSHIASASARCPARAMVQVRRLHSICAYAGHHGVGAQPGHLHAGVGRRHKAQDHLVAVVT